MPIVRDQLQQEIDRKLELEDREYFDNQEKLARKHELQVIRTKTKIRTRWNGYVNIIRQIMLVLPRCIAIVFIGLIVLCNKPVPKSLEDLLS